MAASTSLSNFFWLFLSQKLFQGKPSQLAYQPFKVLGSLREKLISLWTIAG